VQRSTGSGSWWRSADGSSVPRLYVHCATAREALVLSPWLTFSQAAEYCGVDPGQRCIKMLKNREVRCVAAILLADSPLASIGCVLPACGRLRWVNPMGTVCNA
jgi:hypothetical protein